MQFKTWLRMAVSRKEISFFYCEKKKTGNVLKPFPVFNDMNFDMIAVAAIFSNFMLSNSFSCSFEYLKIL